jgi:beta-lactamase regulating signal transducer with metallopeptidase domain
MIIWMIYVIAVSLLLGCAALALERGARLRKVATRGYWLAAMIASLVLPTIIASVSVELPDNVVPAASGKLVALRETTSIPLNAVLWQNPVSAQLARSQSLETVAKSAWLFVSMAMLAALVTNGIQLYRRKRAWRTREISGARVHVAPDVGPAVIGFLRPEIVVPAWLEESTPAAQASVVAHERSHLEAKDPQLFTVALCLVVLVPWNLPLWWQLRRLRHAIEVDCDARVIGAGVDAQQYGETLIAVGERQSSFIGAVAAMSESASLLEQRIQIMLSKPAKWWQVTSTALACLSLTLVAVAAQVSPPNKQPAETTTEGETHDVALPPDVLEHYVGDYQLSDSLVMHVTRSGAQLSVRISGQPAFQIRPTSSTHFYLQVPTIKAQLDFVAVGSGNASAVVLHQNGQNVTMPRIDAALAEQIESTLATRMQASTPTPGAEAALRRVIERGQAGLPTEYETMSPQLAEAARQQQANVQQVYSSLGAMQSMQFQGVGAQGEDAYLVKFEHGTMLFRIALDAKGIITGLQMRPL